MTLSDFEKQPRGFSLIDAWTAITPISTPIGNFGVEMQMGVGDRQPPDDEMLRHVAELIGLLRRDFDGIRDKVFEHYRSCAAIPGFDSCGVPGDLDGEGILKHLDERTLTVSRRKSFLGARYSSRVYIIPAWDVEHGLYIAYRRGEWQLGES